MLVTSTYSPSRSSMMELPLFTMSVSAGLPTQADDHVDKTLDLNEYIVRHPQSTYFVRVHGESMIDAGVYDGDLLVVDQSIPAGDGHIVIAVVNGEMTVKTLRIIDGETYLEAQNKTYLPIRIDPYVEFRVMGVVTHVIRSLR